MILILFWVGISWGSSSSSDEASFVDNTRTYEIRLSSPLQDIPGKLVCQSMIKIAVSKYFHDRPQVGVQLAPLIEHKLEQMRRNSSAPRYNKFRQFALNNSDTPDQKSDDPEVDLFMEEVLSHVLRERIEQEEQERERYQIVAHERVSKRNVAIIAGVSSVLCTLISAGITLAVSMNTDC